MARRTESPKSTAKSTNTTVQGWLDRIAGTLGGYIKPDAIAVIIGARDGKAVRSFLRNRMYGGPLVGGDGWLWNAHTGQPIQNVTGRVPDLVTVLEAWATKAPNVSIVADRTEELEASRKREAALAKRVASMEARIASMEAAKKATPYGDDDEDASNHDRDATRPNREEGRS